MRNPLPLLLCGLLAAAFSPAAAAQLACGNGSTSTHFSGGDAGAGYLIDFTPTVDMEICAIEYGLSSSVTALRVHWAPQSCVGIAQNPGAWSLLASGTATGGGATPALIDVSGNGVTFAAGQTYALYLDFSGPYSAGLGVLTGSPGPGQTYPGDHCSITTRYKNTAYHGAPSDADWNGTLHTDAVLPTGPQLAVSGSCPGPVSLDVTLATPGGLVGFGYALSAGSVALPGGPCAGTVIPLAGPVQLGVLSADAAGAASFAGNAPPNACGNVLVIALDVATCLLTPVVAV